MDKFKFKFVSLKNQVLVKEDDYGDEIDIIDFFNTNKTDDYIAGYFINIDYTEGILSIVGELSKDEVNKILEKESYLDGGYPNIYDVKQRLEMLNETWEIDWEIAELRDEDDELI